MLGFMPRIIKARSEISDLTELSTSPSLNWQFSFQCLNLIVSVIVGH